MTDTVHTKEQAALFWAKVNKAGPDECWEYQGFRKWDGYGWLGRSVNGKTRNYTAHRYAWIITNGEPEKGMHVLHRCDNPPCCNPKHLWLGTHQENMIDQRAKGRGVHGERTKVNKLTAKQAAAIRAMKPIEPNRSGLARRLAETYGVRDGAIHAIWRGAKWKNTAPANPIHPDRVRPRRQQ